MKTLKMNIGLLALILGLTIAITGSAFKTVVSNGTYGQVNGSGPWVDTSLSPGPGQEYYCDLVGQLCKAEFTSDPETDENAEIVPNSEESGTLKIREIDN